MLLISKLSGLAQVAGMAYVAYRGTAPEWMRWAFAAYVVLFVVVNHFEEKAS